MDDLAFGRAGSDAARADAAREWRVRELGRRAYEPVWRAMQAFTDARIDDTPDEVWVVEHDPVFTLGQAGKPEHVLMPGEIPVIHVDRAQYDLAHQVMREHPEVKWTL